MEPPNSEPTGVSRQGPDDIQPADWSVSAVFPTKSEKLGDMDTAKNICEKTSTDVGLADGPEEFIPGKHDAGAIAGLADASKVDDDGVMSVDDESGDAAKKNGVRRVNADGFDDSLSLQISATTDEAVLEAASPVAASSHITDMLEAALIGITGVDHTTQDITKERREEQQQKARMEDLRQHEEATLLSENRPADEKNMDHEDHRADDGRGVDWEVDSSPYETSSSDTDSSDDSDDDESEGLEGELLGVQDTVRMLMQSAMQESDDEDGDGNQGVGGGSAAQVRTKNEIPEAVPPTPQVKIGPDDEIVFLGSILHVVENTAVIQGDIDGAYRVLDEGSVLCTADRTVVGVVSDVIGNVRGPMYVLRVGHDEDGTGLIQQGLIPGQELYYPTKHAVFVFTEALRGSKGSDASNLHDEEVGADEVEFSDDEKEAAYRRELKARRRGGAVVTGNSNNRKGQKRGAHSARNDNASENGAGVSRLTYDDEDDDGPYKPLTRPAHFGKVSPSGPPTSPSKGGTGGGGSSNNNGRTDGFASEHPRFNRGRRGGGERGGRELYRARGGNRGLGCVVGGAANPGDWKNDNEQTGAQQFRTNPVGLPPPVLHHPQQYGVVASPFPLLQQQPSGPWPFSGVPPPPPPPPPPPGGAPYGRPFFVIPPATDAAAALALLNNLRFQQQLRQHQEQQQQSGGGFQPQSQRRQPAPPPTTQTGFSDSGQSPEIPNWGQHQQPPAF
ncbi:snornp assembly factor [Niveomyces insectorum RCEF 264]|uniref:H/ACA ribonucleoprotein complex non-core subunit NAF1 n=1 Tax=Niveomyces insectorum RCEF 264 TaxID=1081102 RepID=A0A167ZQX8_9HYPO|nr:snornp assembly factor [Niveomyces insectorum RCEF 264]